jgi:hypothetical protein
MGKRQSAPVRSQCSECDGNNRRLMLRLRFVQEAFDKHREESDDAHCQIHGDARNHPCAIVSYGLQSLSNDFLDGDNETFRSCVLLTGSSARRA